MYRYYPTTGVYLIVESGSQVYVLGGGFGERVIHVGALNAFLRPLSGGVTGLTATGLVLENQGELLSVPAGASSFEFSLLQATGSGYAVTVRTAPAGLTCSVVNGSGTVGAVSGVGPSVVCPASTDLLAPPAPVPLATAALAFGIDTDSVDLGSLGGSDGGTDGSDGGADGGDGGAAGGAGDGAPHFRARVTLTDSTGRTVAGLTDANGRFLLRFNTSTFVAPYVLRAVDASGNVRTSVIVEPIRRNTAVWTHINSLTDKVVSDALAPSAGGTDKAFSVARIDLGKLARAKADLVTSVRSALGAAGIGTLDRFDPLRSNYAYNGTGVDAVMDSLNHTRDPASGATQLRSKLLTVANNAVGSEIPRLVTAASPLGTSALALPGGQGLTFAKLKQWVTEFNRCLGLSVDAYRDDETCLDADGSRLVRTDFRADGKDFHESLRTLFSEHDGGAVVGSQLRSPSVLFVDRSAGSAIDDLAIVQFTVFQPYVGPKGPNGPVGGAVEYPVVTVFKRDDTLTRARAGNWILYGDQRRYDLTIQPRYYRFTQGNPARLDASPSYLNASLRMLVMRRRYDMPSRTYVDANIRAVRVLGPGLPRTGVVLAPSSACGSSTYLSVLNKLGQVPSGNVTASIVQNDFRLASVRADGTAFSTPGSYFPTRDIAINAIPFVTDFSPLRAYSVYRFEIFLRSNPGNLAPDAVETVRILAPVMPPGLALNLPMNDVTPSLPLITPGAPALPANVAAAINWTNNVLAARVASVSLYAEERNLGSLTQPVRFNIILAQVAGAYSVGAVPSAQLVVVPSVAADANCTGGQLSTLDGTSGLYREVTLSSQQGQSRVFSSMGWFR